jgi:hypothetical protein
MQAGTGVAVLSASVTPATTPDAPTGIAITTENTNHGYSSIEVMVVQLDYILYSNFKQRYYQTLKSNGSEHIAVTEQPMAEAYGFTVTATNAKGAVAQVLPQ